MTNFRPNAALLIEAGLAIAVASLAIRLCSFGWVTRHIPAQQGPLPPAGIATIARLRRALLAWSRRLPWRTLCFEQGLAAHCMLRRRGFASTLFYGAAKIDGKLKAHVWVRSGELDVIGCDNATDFAQLASFPQAPSSLPVKPLCDRQDAGGVGR